MTVAALQKKYLPLLAPEDFFLLIAYATNTEKVFLLAHPEYELPPEALERAEDSLKRRLKHEPVAYITRHKEFYGREFLVTPDTLIPRPETELLVEAILKKTADQEGEIAILDIGTGSGNIIITLASELTQKKNSFFGIDISPLALTTAKKNAAKNNVDTKIKFLESDLLENFLSRHIKNHHVIIAANLPYLSREIYNASESDVRDYEPQSALVSEDAGLNHYLRLLPQLHALSQHALSMTFFFEISPEQTGRITLEIKSVFPQVTLTVLQDLSGKDRLIQASI